MARPNFCLGCLAFLLKFLAFLQVFAGVSAAIYGVWALNRWAHQGGAVDLHHISDLWFVCTVIGVGVVFIFIALVGYVAAEASSACCLCSYAMFATILMLLEAALAGDLLFNKHWKQDIPQDPTRELNNLLAFVENNMDICRWVAGGVIVTQMLALFLATLVRVMVLPQRSGYDSDEDFVIIRRPLLVAQGAPTYVPGPVDGSTFHSNSWSTRMRQKYGLNQEYAYNTVDPNASVPR